MAFRPMKPRQLTLESSRAVPADATNGRQDPTSAPSSPGLPGRRAARERRQRMSLAKAGVAGHSIADRRYWGYANGHEHGMGGWRRAASKDASAEIGHRIDARHEADIRFFRRLRKRALRRSRALNTIRRGHSADLRIPPPRSSDHSL